MCNNLEVSMRNIRWTIMRGIVNLICDCVPDFGCAGASSIGGAGRDDEEVSIAPVSYGSTSLLLSCLLHTLEDKK